MKHLKSLSIIGTTILLLALVLASSAQETQKSEEIDCPEVMGVGIDLAYYVGVGNVHFDLGNYTTAVSAYSCAIYLDPSYVPAYIDRGYAYTIQGNDILALEDYDQALGLDAMAIGAYNNRGIQYMMLGRFGLALTDFDLAIALAPDYAITYNNRGVVHAAEGHYQLAIADFMQAIALDPDYAEPHASLGMVYSAMSVDSYANYREIVGQDERLPAGDADIVLNALDANRESGTFSIWLATLTESR
jgi:tetratricopeptide (TPR) repeat protein